MYYNLFLWYSIYFAKYGINYIIYESFLVKYDCFDMDNLAGIIVSDISAYYLSYAIHQYVVDRFIYSDCNLTVDLYFRVKFTTKTGLRARTCALIP